MKMQKPQFIQHMMVDQARYRLRSGSGEEVELLVNYKDNAYEVVTAREVDDSEFLDEANRLAQGLLSRKHAVNLAEREQYL